MLLINEYILNVVVFRSPERSGRGRRSAAGQGARGGPRPPTTPGPRSVACATSASCAPSLTPSWVSRVWKKNIFFKEPFFLIKKNYVGGK